MQTRLRTVKRGQDSDSNRRDWQWEDQVKQGKWNTRTRKSNVLLHEYLVLRIGTALLLLLHINFLTTLLLKYKF